MSVRRAIAGSAGILVSGGVIAGIFATTASGQTAVPIASIHEAASPTGGYWLVTADGAVTAFGSAVNYGGLSGYHLDKPIVNIVPTPDGKGYWLFAADGGVFTFGDAGFYGSNGTKPAGDNTVAGAAVPTSSQGTPTTGTYAYVYQTGTENVANNAAVTFAHAGPTSGATFSPGGSGVTVDSAGAYAVTFSIAPLDPTQFSIAVNGVVDPSAVYNNGESGPDQPGSGQAILNLNAGDVVTLVNTGGASMALENFFTGTQPSITASLQIEQLG